MSDNFDSATRYSDRQTCCFGVQRLATASLASVVQSQTGPFHNLNGIGSIERTGWMEAEKSGAFKFDHESRASAQVLGPDRICFLNTMSASRSKVLWSLVDGFSMRGQKTKGRKQKSLHTSLG